MPKERLKSAAYLMSICKKICKISYRTSDEVYNDDYRRTGTESEIPLSTLASDFNQEGRRLRAAKNEQIVKILSNTPFDPETGRPLSKLLPEGYRPSPLKEMKISYSEAMHGEKPLWVRLQEPDGETVRDWMDALNDEIDISEIEEDDGFWVPCYASQEEDELEKQDDEQPRDTPAQSGGSEGDDGHKKGAKGRGTQDPQEFMKSWLNSENSKKYSMPDSREIPVGELQRRTRKRPVLAPAEDRRQRLLDYVNYVNTTQATCPGLGIPRDWDIEVDPNCVVSISIDVVYVPMQKRTGRQSEGTDPDTFETEFGGKKNIGHLDIKVEHGPYQYNITGANKRDPFRELMAVISVNKLYQYPMYVFADGEEKLISKLKEFIGPWDPRVFLDWSHLAHKAYEKSSMIFIQQRVVDPRGNHELYEEGSDKEGQVKKYEMTSLSRLYARQLVRMLWLGNVDEAIAFLENVDPDHIKSVSERDRLIGYLRRKESWIPCYALRRLAGLKNASSPVESENEAVVSNRQKSGGDHWSEDGSANNASMRALFLNHEEENWFLHGIITFKMFNPADNE